MDPIWVRMDPYGPHMDPIWTPYGPKNGHFGVHMRPKKRPKLDPKESCAFYASSRTPKALWLLSGTKRRIVHNFFTRKGGGFSLHIHTRRRKRSMSAENIPSFTSKVCTKVDWDTNTHLSLTRRNECDIKRSSLSGENRTLFYLQSTYESKTEHARIPVP